MSTCVGIKFILLKEDCRSFHRAIYTLIHVQQEIHLLVRLKGNLPRDFLRCVIQPEINDLFAREFFLACEPTCPFWILAEVVRSLDGCVVQLLDVIDMLLPPRAGVSAAQ